MIGDRGPSLLFAVGALAAGIGVGLGAYGAHGLHADGEIEKIWDTGVAYQMWHALGAFAASWLATRRDGGSRKLALLSGWALLLGAFLFSGVLYYFAIDGTIILEGAAPAGGFLMMGGWLGLAVAALWRQKTP